MTAPSAPPAAPRPDPSVPKEDPAYRSPFALPHSAEDVAVFEGPSGFAAVRRPTSSTAPKRIGDAQGKQYGFYRVAFCLKGKGSDVWQVADVEEGRVVAKTLAELGHLNGLKPNGGKYRVTAF